MPAKRVLSPNSVWDLAALQAAFRAAGVKEGHAVTVLQALLRQPQVAWSDIPSLPKAAQAVLEAGFTRLSSRVQRIQQSCGGDTTKLLIDLQDGLQVEAVCMHYDTADRYVLDPAAAAAGWGNKRATLCVSSQVGCQMGCTFCATGTMGLKGNLSAGEIVEQLVHASRVTPVRNIVFMGMGEPLQNWEAVCAAVQLMADSRLWSLSRRHITVSTVGVIPRIRAFAAELPGVSLALSLHAPTQELRAQIVPSARAYPLPKLLAAVAEYQAASQQRVFVEYVLLAAVNDGLQQAHELGTLLAGRDVVVNLIPWNPVFTKPGDPAFDAPPAGRARDFQAVLRGYGLPCTVRQEKGQDIAGACGQLVIQAGHAGACATDTAAQAAAAARLRDIEELAGH